MVSTESPVLPLSQVTDAETTRRRGLELFCLSFLALFLELMVIRWAPAVDARTEIRILTSRC